MALSTEQKLEIRDFIRHATSAEIRQYRIAHPQLTDEDYRSCLNPAMWLDPKSPPKVDFEATASAMTARLTRIFNELQARYPDCLTIEGGMHAATVERNDYVGALLQIVRMSDEATICLLALAALHKHRAPLP